MTRWRTKTERRAIIATYALGHSLRETGRLHGISMQGVHQLLQRMAPHLIRVPYIGKHMHPDERLKKCTGVA